jgi:hypothetical protein
MLRFYSWTCIQLTIQPWPNAVPTPGVCVGGGGNLICGGDNIQRGMLRGAAGGGGVGMYDT